MTQPVMTAFAQAALKVSDLVGARFSSTRFSGSVTRVVKVQAPNVPSTGGGKQARESIVLMPENGDTSQALTCGFIDVGLRSVEIRDHAALAVVAGQRGGSPLDIPKGEYDAFVRDLQAFLGGEGYICKLIEEREQVRKAATGARDRVEDAGASKKSAFIAVGVAGVALVAVVVYLLTSG